MYYIYHVLYYVHTCTYRYDLAYAMYMHGCTWYILVQLMYILIYIDSQQGFVEHTQMQDCLISPSPSLPKRMRIGPVPVQKMLVSSMRGQTLLKQEAISKFSKGLECQERFFEELHILLAS